MKNKIRILILLLVLCFSIKVNAMPVLNEKNSVHLKCKISEMSTTQKGNIKMTVTITHKGKWNGHCYSFILSKRDMKEWRAELNHAFKANVLKYLKKHGSISKNKYLSMNKQYQIKKGSVCYILLYTNGTKTVKDDEFVNIYKLIKAN